MSPMCELGFTWLYSSSWMTLWLCSRHVSHWVTGAIGQIFPTTHDTITTSGFHIIWHEFENYDDFGQAQNGNTIVYIHLMNCVKWNHIWSIHIINKVVFILRLNQCIWNVWVFIFNALGGTGVRGKRVIASEWQVNEWIDGWMNEGAV